MALERVRAASWPAERRVWAASAGGTVERCPLLRSGREAAEALDALGDDVDVDTAHEWLTDRDLTGGLAT